MLLMAITLPTLAVAETISHTITLNSSNLTIGTDTLGGVTYTTIHYAGLDNHGAPGTPSLPVDYIRFSVPYNATNFTVTTTTRFPLESKIPHMVYPCQTPRQMNDTSSWAITLPDSSIYFSGSYYPANLATIVDEGFLAGENHIVTVAVTPYSCIHVSNSMTNYKKIKKPQSVTVKLTYQTGGPLLTEPIVRRDTVLRNEGFALTRSMVVNPNAVRPNAVPDTSIYMQLHGIVSPGQSYPVDSTATYLIVTTQDLKHSTRRLAALKRQEGYSVKVVTMDEVLASPYSGDGDRVQDSLIHNDPPGKLREYLRYCFHNFGTTYVLLAGTDVPWKSFTIKGEDNTLYESPTDSYYCDLNSYWIDDSIELNPDLYVGRILSKSESQIENYTDKLLRYELNPGHGDYQYLKRAFFLEGRDFDGKLDSPKMHLTAYYPNQICINDTASNNSGHPNGVDIIDTLNNNHVGLLIPFNHGSPDGIKVYGKDSNGYNSYIFSLDSITTYENEDGIDCLNNKDYPMIFYAPCCKTIPYDYTSGMNFGESFTTGKDYGGPAYIGYTRDALGMHVDYLLSDWINLLPLKEYKISVAYAFSKEIYCGLFPSRAFKKYQYINEPIRNAYIGDPTIELWTDIPQEYSNISITRTENSITVSGLDVDSTIVAYCDNNYHAGYRLTSSTSLTLNSVSPNSTIMLFKHNYLPYIAPLSLQNINIKNSQYVIASDVTAGFSVENGRLPGNVVVKSGAEYEIEATGTVTLKHGFKVEKGATFAVYPACF